MGVYPKASQTGTIESELNAKKVGLKEEKQLGFGA
jgi:hypothetical protein